MFCLPKVRQFTFLDESDGEEHAELDDTVIEGQELYLHFFHEQLRKAGIENQIAAKQEEG